MSDKPKISKDFLFLTDLKSREFVYNRNNSHSLAEVIAVSDIPYQPGIYLVYDFSKGELGDLLYVGKAGANKYGKINTHQLPKRLLAVCYPPDKYLKDERYKNKFSTRKDVCRYDAWPKMMEIDNIDSIKIFCYFSKIINYQVSEDSNPLKLEAELRKIYKSIPSWAKK